MDEEDTETLVIDNGSRWIKAGFAGNDAPFAVFPSVVGLSRYKTSTIAPVMNSLKQKYVGMEAIAKRGLLTLKYTIKRGIVTDWDNMEAIWHHTIREDFRIYSDECAVLITEPPLHPKQDREKMTQIMFDTFRVRALYVANSAVLALHASDRKTGIVLQSGEDITHIVPIFDGHALTSATCTLELGGKHLTDYLAKLLAENHNFKASTYSDMELVRDMKESRCCAATGDSEDDEIDAIYELPEGGNFDLGDTCFKCAEVLFNPKLIGINSVGIHDLVHTAIRKCDPCIRGDLYKNIVLAGGNTKFPGLPERLKKEIEKLVSVKVEVVAPPERVYSTWIGGSLMGMNKDNWITLALYQEYGPGIVNMRCPQSSFQAEAMSSSKILFNQKMLADVVVYTIT